MFLIKAYAAKGGTGEGVWRTINGSHVFIQNGRITKGPAKLVGSTTSDLEKSSKSTADRKKELQEKRASKSSSSTSSSGSKNSNSKSEADSGSKETLTLNYTKNHPGKVSSSSTITSREITYKSNLQVKPTKTTTAPTTEAQKQAIISNSQKVVNPIVESFLSKTLKNSSSTYKSQVKSEAEGLCRVAARRGASVVNVHPEGKSLVLTFSDGTQRRAGSNTSDPFSDKFM